MASQLLPLGKRLETPWEVRLFPLRTILTREYRADRQMCRF